MNIPKTVAENLALWQDSLLQNHELCLLELTALGKELGSHWQAQEAQPLSSLSLPRMARRKDASPAMQAFLQTLDVAQQIAFCDGLFSY